MRLVRGKAGEAVEMKEGRMAWSVKSEGEISDRLIAAMSCCNIYIISGSRHKTVCGMSL